MKLQKFSRGLYPWTPLNWERIKAGKKGGREDGNRREGRKKGKGVREEEGKGRRGRGGGKGEG
jgi:hypothetical protein